MKKRYFGSEDMLLHASSLSSPSAVQLQALNRFFAQTWFYRFAYIVRKPVILPKSFNALSIILPFLLEEFLIGLSNLDPLPPSVSVVHEASNRLDPKLMKLMGGLSLHRLDGTFIPFTYGFQDSHSSRPILEVADFVTHAAQGQFGRSDWLRKDFMAVFHSNDTAYSRYVELDVNSFSWNGNKVIIQRHPEQRASIKVIREQFL